MRKYKKKSNLVNNTGYTPGYSTENNPINFIPSENITMENTPYPVYGQPLDQFGNAIDNPTYMEPGNEYKFGGASFVAETKAYKEGGQKNDWISHKIGILMGEGRPQKQAIAIAYSMWEQRHEMGGEHLPMMQNGDYYQNNPTGFQTNFTGEAPKVDGRFNFTPSPQIPGTIGFSANKTEPWQYGLGANPNATNALGTQPTDFSKNFPLPAGVSEPLTKGIGYKKMTPEELSKGVQNAGTNDGGESARQNASGNGVTQFDNPYGDIGMEGALGFSGEQFAKGNTGMGIVGAAVGAMKGAKSFLQGMGAQKRENQVMKNYAEEQRKNMTGEGRETPIGRRGGYFQDGGKDKSNYNSEIDKDIRNNYQSFGPQEMPQGIREEASSINPVFGPSNAPEGYVEPTAQTSLSARDTWEQKTGLPWSKAKELGYTDGTARDNIKLISELNDPRFKKENLRSGTTKPNTPRKADKKSKDFTYQDFQEATKNKPKYSGSHGNIGVPDEGNMVTRLGERLANPLQTVGHYAKYGEVPAEGFSKNSKNAYDQGIGIVNPLYWANALGNASDYASEGEYKKAAAESLDAAPLLGKLKYVKYLPIPGKAPGVAQGTSKGLQVLENASRASNPQLGQAARRIGEGTKQYGQLSFGFEQGGYFQEGGVQSPEEEQQEGAMSNPQEEQGEVPQQGGGDQMQQIAQQVAQMLQQGADPQQVLQQLVQAGVPQEQAQQIIQMVMGQMQGGQQGTPQLKCGGKMYQEGGEAMDEQREGENEGAEGETPNQEDIEGQVEQALKQGANPQEVLKQLIQMGMPEQQAVQMIQELLKEIQGGETEVEAPEEGQQMMKNGGEYLAMLKGRTIKNYTYNKNTGNYDVEFE